MALGQNGPLHAYGLGRVALNALASNGVLQSRDQLLWAGGDSFLVSQELLWVPAVLHHGLEILRSIIASKREENSITLVIDGVPQGLILGSLVFCFFKEASF